MKKLLLILLCLPMIGFGQFTYVPDDNFEQALINLGYDTFLDNNVTTASIDTVTYLNIDNQGIADLTGIADFTSLATLSCNNNQLSSLVVLNPSLLNLSCTNNQMLNLDVSNNGVNGSLVSVDCSFNQLTSLLIINNINLNYLNCSNNLLTTLAFGNTTLFDLNCSYNLFTELDVSSCNALVSLNCSNNDLNTLDVRNGNNVIITNANFNSTLNSNLNCIDVDNPPYSIANWLNIDAWSSFSINCPPVVFGCTDTLSCNYNASANIDDGSCQLAGCIDLSACNYDVNAFCDDGSCIYLNTSVSISNVSCNGFTDGSLVATASGGVSPYQYSLNSSVLQSSGNFSNLLASTYTLSVIDNNACLYSQNIIITSPIALTYSANINHISCYDTCDGNINLVAQGGTAPYSYLWNTSPIQNSSLADSLCVGIHDFIITDANGCIVSDSFEINDNNAVPTISNVSLFGCDSILIGTNYLTSTGTFTDIFSANNGCDSIINTTFTIGQSTSSYDTLSVSAGIVWNGIFLNISGDYSITLNNSTGCDSVVNLNLTIPLIGCTDTLACNYDSLATIDDSSCIYSVIWYQTHLICDGDSIAVGNNIYDTAGVYMDTLNTSNGCDSVVHTYLMIDENTSSYDTLSVGAGIVWNGMPLNVSGDYSVTLINSVGCDSIVNLNLTVTTTGISDITNTKSNLVKITDMLGQETPYRRNTPLFYIYDDGTVEKRIILE